MVCTRSTLLLAACGLSLALSGGGVSLSPRVDAADALPATVEFNRDIRPILADHCFACHGPDQNKRKADLRLDLEESARADRGGYHAIVPGKLDESELYQRITAERLDKRMPPQKVGKPLSERQIALLRRWIEQGAKWQKHWAFIPPTRQPLPKFTREPKFSREPQASGWPRNAIDHFVLARLDHEGLQPSPEADQTTLLRRVTLDLTGLPPTPAELDAFLTDDSPNAYEKVVDRLLASPRYGERMARPWLDAARYADTNGYQSDGERFMWRWRDWVIEAFNNNMPFDQFTIEQIAGDMLPNATLEQKIASGFNRNHRGNGEGGVIPEEYAVEYVVDRVDTTATVWLGLTMGCARCHDHKYDPLAQKEFYQFFAFFNNVPEKGRANKYGNSPPMIKTPTRDQHKRLEELNRKLTEAEARFAKLEPELATAQAAWEKLLKPAPPIQWFPGNGLVVHHALDGDTKGTWHRRDAGGTATFVPGRLGQAGDFDGKRFIDAGDVAGFGFYDKFSCAAWVSWHRRDAGGTGGTILSRMVDSPQADGYYLVLDAGKVQVNLVKRWLDDAARVETEGRLTPNQWHHVVMTYDGSREAGGIKVYINGQPAKMKVLLDELNQSFATKEPLRIGGGGGPEGRFHGQIDEVRVYDRLLSREEAAILATSDAISEIAVIPPVKRTTGQAAKIRTYFLEQHAPEPLKQAQQQVLLLRKQRDEHFESIPTTMVMEEMPTPRDTFVLIRGQYDKPGEKVTPGVPAAVHVSQPGGIKNRLGFAKWLVQPANPLTARVAVNRYWQMYFGTGLVKTIEDFGTQGEWPSHPELLDWLATEFARTGWDVKAMQKLIVTSATYRQSSKVTPALMQRDPENRLLARGPRFRLPADMVRDQALAIGGLLVEKIGGPSVKPYQPPGLWKELTGTDEYEQDHGEKLYRRSLYTFWKRTVPPPAMTTFDAMARETCVVRETRTNTPLQALNLMNDVTYVEAARLLAERIMGEEGATLEDRITLAFRLATARKPRPAELQVLVNSFQDHLARYRKDPKAALRLVSIGEYRRNEKLEVSELAAYAAVCGLILNLDEVITKE